MSRNKEKQIICIEWVDASVSRGDETYTQEDAEEEKLVHGFAVGVLVKEFSDRYVISRDWFNDFNNYRGIASYPKTGVVKVTKYILKKGSDAKNK
jgi:hypothetical protein